MTTLAPLPPRRRAVRLLRCLVLAVLSASSAAAAPALEVFAGSAARPPLEELARRFHERTGTEVQLLFGGSGAVLAQMELSGRGDVYLSGSSDFLEVARERGLLEPGSEVRFAYLLPVLAVAKGNPRAIRRLEDLARPGLRVGMARPETVCVGLYGVEVLERSGLAEAVRPNVVNTAESCLKTAQMLSLGLVDAVLGWDVYDDWDPARIEVVPLPPGQVPRIGYMAAAVAATARDRRSARRFVAYLAGAEAQAVLRRHGYLATLEEARRLARPDTPVGGRFLLPAGWR